MVSFWIASFRIVDCSEIPAEWLSKPCPDYWRHIALQLEVPAGEEHRLREHVTLSMPDCPIFRDYYFWAAAQPAANVVALMVESPEVWVKQYPKRVRETFMSILFEGRPALVWNRTYYTVSKPNNV